LIEGGLFSLIQANVPDFNGLTAYQMYYLAVFDPVPLPYCVFRRYKREAEPDLSSNYGLYTSGYILNIYHDDSWALLDLQQRIRVILEGLPNTTLSGTSIQALIVLDDFHTVPALMQEARTRAYQGVLDFEIIHPNV